MNWLTSYFRRPVPLVPAVPPQQGPKAEQSRHDPDFVRLYWLRDGEEICSALVNPGYARAYAERLLRVAAAAEAFARGRPGDTLHG